MNVAPKKLDLNISETSGPRSVMSTVSISIRAIIWFSLVSDSKFKFKVVITVGHLEVWHELPNS